MTKLFTKNFYVILVISLFTGISLPSLAQTTSEYFEGATAGANFFVNAATGIRFNFTNQFAIESIATFGVDAHTPASATAYSSNYFDNFSGPALNQTNAMKTADGSLFTTKSIYVYPSSDPVGNSPTNDGTVTFVGKIAGVTKYTFTASGGFETSVQDGSGNFNHSGFTLIDFSGFTDINSTPVSNVPIDELDVVLGSKYVYVALDNFIFAPATAPTPTTINSVNTVTSSTTNATSVQYTATFGASVAGLTATNFALVQTGVSGASITSVSTGPSATYTVTVNTGTGDGTLGLNLANATGLTPGISTTLPFAGQTYTIDKTAPTNTISAPSLTITKNTSVTYTVTYADAHFNASTLATGNITLNKTGTANGTLGVSGSGTTRTVTISGITGDGTLGISLAAGTGTDLAGNATPAAGPSTTFIVDNTAPTNTISAPSATITKNTNVTYTVTYADANFNSSTLATGNITLNKTGTANGTVGISGSGTTRTVTISGITGDGTLGISIAAGTGTDLATNATLAAGPSTTFIVDNTAPTNTISAPSVSITKNTSVTYTVTYADANFNSSTLATGNITLNKTGTANGTLGVSGSGTTRTVTISGITGDGTLGISIAAGTGTDLAGNATLAAGPSTTFIVDNTAPTISISAPSASSTTAGPVTYTVTYADANFNSATLATGNITLNTTGGANGTVGVVNSGTTSTVTISSITGTGTIGISIAAGTASDLAGNLAPAAGPSATFTVGAVLSSDATLSSITTSVGTLSPTFSPGVLNYTVNVINTVNAIRVTPTVNDPTATVKVAGAVVPSGTQTTFDIPLNPGSNAVIVKGIAQDGVTKITYTLNVVRSALASDAFLSNLALSAGTITPGFAPSVFNYTASVPNATSSMTVTPTEEDVTGNATITVNGNPVTSGSPATVALSVGANTITTIVTAQNGINTFTYTTVVIRSALSSDATLSNITTSIGTLSPTFSPGTLNYTVNVINTLNAIRVTPTANNPNATIKVAGAVVTSGTQIPFDIPLNYGSNNVIIKGIAQDGVTKITYTINVIRSTLASDAFLSNLALSDGTITPAFAPSVFNYTASVPNSTASMTVTPTEEDPTGMATITVNGNPIASGSPATVLLNAGDNTITTIVTAQNGINTFTYTTTVTRAAGSGSPGLPGGGADLSRYQTISVSPSDSLRLADADVIVHPAVSPNGDGINDFLYIENIQNHPENKVTLINRSGGVIFEISGYDNYSKVFNGHSSVTGAMIQPGTYYYLVEYVQNGTNKRKTGFFVLR